MRDNAQSHHPAQAEHTPRACCRAASQTPPVLCRSVAVFVLYGDTINGKGGAIFKSGFHPVGVHVVAAGKQFCHNGILQDLIFGVRSLEPMPSSRCRMKYFLVCLGVSARFLHGFCTVSKRAKGANRCKIGQRVQKFEAQNLRCFAKNLR